MRQFLVEVLGPCRKCALPRTNRQEASWTAAREEADSRKVDKFCTQLYLALTCTIFLVAIAMIVYKHCTHEQG